MIARDAYATLGVSRTATEAEIKDAYRRLAKKLHPDLNPGNKEAESRFKDVSQAYEWVGTQESRAKYDRGEFNEASPGPRGPGPGAEGFGGTRAGGARRGPFYYRTQTGADPEGGGGRYTFSFGEGMEEDLDFRFPGEDQLYRMDIDLRDAILGTEKEITLPTGKRLSVRIPKDIAEGARLRFTGHGGPGIGGGPPGDAYVEVHIRPDPRFRQEGADLVLELPVSIGEAVFGSEVRTPTVEGAVMLKIPPRSNTGTQLKLNGKGAYNRSTGRRGNQIVVLRVFLPDAVDPELEAALRAWESHHPYNPRERQGG